jgi:pantoate--beta-alanine ligase
VELIRDPKAWQARCFAERAAGRHLVLVPTMGYLHDGHVALLRDARRRADHDGKRGFVCATIFVNPTQFGPNEDLARYPRDLNGDLARCGDERVDAVLAPERPDQVYAAGHQSWVDVEGVSRGLCGASRPGHFRGVATIVTKLFNLTRPHVAVFGEKDWQQLQVIRTFVRDLDFAIEIVGVPIVREADGLALSSRNAYLSADERRRALAISGSLHHAQQRVLAGVRDVTQLVADARQRIEGAGGRVDYVEIVHPETLEPVAEAASGSRMLVAAFFGTTRLIDNVALP